MSQAKDWRRQPSLAAMSSRINPAVLLLGLFLACAGCGSKGAFDDSGQAGGGSGSGGGSSGGGSGGGGGGSGGGGSGGGGPTDTVVVGVTITPGAVLLTEAGASQPLTAEAVNAAGQALSTSITWTSNDPTDVSINSNGVATAEDDAGSALITASAGGVTSTPILALVALPDVDSVLVSDDQFVAGPVPVDPDDNYDTGFRYLMTVSSDVATERGDILISTGGTPVVGEVEDVDENGDGTFEVTVSLVSIEQAFSELVFDETFDIDGLPIELDSEVANFYDVVAGSDGSYSLVPKSGVSLDQPSANASSADYGPFSCDFEGGFPLSVAPGLPTLYVLPDIAPRIRYDSQSGGLREFSANGSVVATADLALATRSELDGVVDCSSRLFDVPVPMAGPMAVYLAPQVSVTGGFTLGGQVTTPEVSWSVEGGVTGDNELGIVCPDGQSDCDFVASGAYDVTSPDFDIDLPSGYAGGEFAPFVQGYAKLGLGMASPPGLDAASLDLAETQAGLEYDWMLDTVEEQVRLDNAASYRLSTEWRARSTPDTSAAIQRLRSLLDAKPISISNRSSSNLADRSPQSSSFTVDTAIPQVGQGVTFTLDFAANDTSFLSMYDIGGVNLYHVDDSSSAAPDLIATAAPVSGRTTYDIPWTVDREGGQVYASVESNQLASVATVSLDELLQDQLVLGQACPKTYSPILGGATPDGTFDGAWNATVPTEDGPVTFGSAPFQIVVTETLGNNGYRGEIYSEAILRRRDRGTARMNFEGTIAPADQGGAVSLQVTIPEGRGTFNREPCVNPDYNENENSCESLTAFSFTMRGTAELVCEVDSAGRPGDRFLTLSGSHSWAGEFDTSRVAESEL